MNYKVHDTKRGKVFETLKEAQAYANEIEDRTHVIVAITETRAKVTHIYTF